MGWLAQKLDVFLAAAVIAIVGALASQTQIFAQQYLQRAGGHLDEARAHLSDVQGGLRYRVMADTVRQELEAAAKERVAVLERAYNGVKNANVFSRPFALLRADPAILAGTRRDFRPAVPLDADSITYTIVGMVLGFILYEIVKLPVVAILREPRRRKFRKRG